MTWFDVAETGRADGRRPRDTPERRLQQQCRRVARLKGFVPWHLSQARATQQTSGLPDDFLTGGPRPIAVEFKVRPRRQTAEQRIFQECWEASGGVYWLIYDVEAFLAALEAIR